MKLADQIAVAVLAATDAVFIPDGDPMARLRQQVICERRGEFPSRGVPWASEAIGPGLQDPVCKNRRDRSQRFSKL